MVFLSYFSLYFLFIDLFMFFFIDGDTVYLANNSNVVISSCSRNLNELSVTETILNNHPMHLFLLRTIATCCYLRLLSLFVLLVATSLRWHGIIIDSFILSMFFDFLSR